MKLPHQHKNKDSKRLQNNPSTSDNAQQTPGNTPEELKPDDLQDTLVEIRFLAHSWLDDFEKIVFKGKTVDELLGQKSHE
jgi:hypothetical protein